MTLVLAILTLLATTTALAVAGSHDKKPGGSFVVSIGTAAVYPPRPDRPCPGSRRAIRFYRAAYTAHRRTMGEPGAPALVHGGCKTARTMAVKWRALARQARITAEKWKREQFEWWRWMPRGSKEYRVASCETGYGRDPNFAHDSGTYVSAWGIYRPAYADDAHRAGNLSWDETRQRLGRIPTPREQWEAMQAHRAAHGGWSGWGCRAA